MQSQELRSSTMAEITDRERLTQLAQEKEQARQRAELEAKQRHADHERQQAEILAKDQKATEELFQFCKVQFEGFKLVPTGHEISVSKAPSSRIFGVEADGVEYAAFNVSHWGEETGDFQGLIPLLLARFRTPQYQVVDIDGKRMSFSSVDEVKCKLVEMISDMDREFMKRLFRKVRDLLARR
jgi:hypothetical protein